MRTGTIIVLTALVLWSAPALATEEFAGQSGLACDECHAVTLDGSLLTELGRSFADGGYEWPLPGEGGTWPSGAPRRVMRIGFGLLHLLACFLWIGTIFYVHLVLRPAYAMGGLPKTELRLAWVSMLVVGLSGAGLVWLRYGGWAPLLASRSGVLILVKAGLFAFLVCSAAFVTLFLSPRLKQLRSGWQRNDGRAGKPAWVKVGDAIYDLSASAHWPDGLHFKRHQAGQDLTEALSGAPHGPEKLEGFASFPAQGAQHRMRKVAVRTLFVMAYLNLFVAVAALVLVAVRRWA